MTHKQNFDQIRVTNPNADPTIDSDIFEPNEVISGKLVFEPMSAQGHVRITARSDEYELLWGVIASQRMLESHPVEVAFYDRLVKTAQTHIHPRTEPAGSKAIAEVLNQVDQLRRSLDAIEQSVSPKKITDKTEKRAAEIVPIISDARRLLISWSLPGEAK